MKQKQASTMRVGEERLAKVRTLAAQRMLKEGKYVSLNSIVIQAIDELLEKDNPKSM